MTKLVTATHAAIAIVALFSASIIMLVVAEFQERRESHAMVGALCHALHDRDQVEAYYDSRIAAIAKRYASKSNQYALHVRPVFEARDRAVVAIALSDCQATMQRAIAGVDQAKL